MPAIGNIYTTVDCGRTHISLGNAYKGSVNSYNNGFTQFFAKLFCLSKVVKIGDKEVHVNKRSYCKFTNKPLNQRHSFKRISKNMLGAMASKGFMRDALSSKKKEKLFNKMVRDLYAGKHFSARKYIGKGADINRNFWIRDNNGYSTVSQKHNLPEASFSIKASRYTPVLYAAQKGFDSLKFFLAEFGADLNASGETTLITRQPSGTIQHVDYVGQTHFVKKHGFFHTSVTPVHTYQPVVSHTTIYSDTVKKLFSFKLNHDLALEIYDVAKERLPAPIQAPAPAPVYVETAPPTFIVEEQPVIYDTYVPPVYIPSSPWTHYHVPTHHHHHHTNHIPHTTHTTHINTQGHVIPVQHSKPSLHHHVPSSGSHVQVGNKSKYQQKINVGGFKPHNSGFNKPFGGGGFKPHGGGFGGSHIKVGGKHH